MTISIQRRAANSISTLLDAQTPPLLQRIFAQRGIQNKSELDTSLERLLPANELANIDTAALLLSDHITKNKNILVIGDFDADGATSSALAIRVLKAMGAAHVDYLVPNRFEYGYGLTPKIVEAALAKRPNLIITVDNGISSIEGVAAAKKFGIKILITDHHLPGSLLPDADAIVNPNLPGDGFKSKCLAGVGVVFYLLLATRTYLRQINWFEQQSISIPNLAQYLDLVAVGTVADVVQLDRNNRILVEQGLRRIRTGRCAMGIQELFAVANRSLGNATASDLGFVIGPRLNAAGRLEDMAIGIECLVTDDRARARRLANQLHELNQNRREIEEGMQQDAIQILSDLQRGLERRSASDNAPYGVVLYNKDWHQGVIGIIAARIKDRIHRPTIVFANAGEGNLKGSARSIRGLHIRDTLDLISTQYSNLITTYGGHAMAAGLTLPEDNFEDFRTVFNQTVKSLISEEDLQSIIYSDGELAENDLNIETAELLKFAAPWGQGFPEPLFDGEFWVKNYRIVADKHLKLNLLPIDGKRAIDAILFNVDCLDWDACIDRVRIAYRLDINEYGGLKSPQLVVQHIESA